MTADPNVAAGPAVEISDGPGLSLDHLFLDAAFHGFQAGAQGKALATFRTSTFGGKGAAALTLAGADGVWTSPITGAFGGVACQGRPAPAQPVFALATAATDWLRARGAAGRVRLAPDSFADPTTAALENALFRQGWRLSGVDLNFHLPVTTGEAFRKGLGETKRQELARLERSGAVVRRLSPSEGERAYGVMADNHAARGFPMTMTWPQMAALAQAFPERVSFHAVERDGEMMAACVLLTVTQAYRYVFNWGEAPAFRPEAPIALLTAGLMAACHAEGAAVLDIGISTDQSQPNAGLIAFKEILRCRTTAKRTYSLEP